MVGGPQTGADFAGLPFDHLLFTGATSVARHVMRAAADNLVPVTLELGGKSPVIVGRSADIEKTTDAIMAGKMMNAGQICLAPDYVFVPKENIGEFVESTQRSVKKMFASLIDNDDYTSIVNQRHFDRLNGYVEDAKQKGARVVEINPANEDFRQQPHHKIPPTLILDANDSMKVMQDEIFGPLMPVRGYDDVSEAVDYVNGHARPLGLYYFGTDEREQQRVLTHTTSGGVTVNDVIMHVAQEDLPFGGVGPSGMGAYHGHDGFKTFSHAKSIFTQSKIDSRPRGTPAAVRREDREAAENADRQIDQWSKPTTGCGAMCSAFSSSSTRSISSTGRSCRSCSSRSNSTSVCRIRSWGCSPDLRSRCSTRSLGMPIARYRRSQQSPQSDRDIARRSGAP